MPEDAHARGVDVRSLTEELDAVRLVLDVDRAELQIRGGLERLAPVGGAPIGDRGDQESEFAIGIGRLVAVRRCRVNSVRRRH